MAGRKVFYRIIMQLLCFISLTAMISGCTGLGKIAKDQYLMTEYKIDLKKKENIKQFKKVHRALSEEITKDPNGKFLWMRPRLAIYNTFKEPKKQKGLKYWFKYKLGEPPVLLDELYCDKLNVTFENRLYHQGYFNARSSFLITKKLKTADVLFDIEAGKPYIIDTLIWPEPTDSLAVAINSTSSNTLIMQGDIYNLNTLKDERRRIDDKLKNMGFYYFNQEFILFQSDTSAGEHIVKLKLTIKKDAPQEGRRVFAIDRIYVAEDYRLENYQPDTIQTGDYTVISASGYMKPKYYLNSILYNQDSL
jgi:outer membrane protein insertion porin family